MFRVSVCLFSTLKTNKNLLAKLYLFGLNCLFISESSLMINATNSAEFQQKLNSFQTQFRQYEQFSEANTVLIISGESLHYALSSKYVEDFLKASLSCKTVICARTSPSQKADVVFNVQEYLKTQDKENLTLAIGDGSNDVPMIQVANVGVGISGMEGTQAANASDFALPQFKFLSRLLLYHGTNSYHRISKTIIYCFYKNIVYHTIQFLRPFKNDHI